MLNKKLIRYKPQNVILLPGFYIFFNFTSIFRLWNDVVDYGEYGKGVASWCTHLGRVATKRLRKSIFIVQSGNWRNPTEPDSIR